MVATGAVVKQSRYLCVFAFLNIARHGNVYYFTGEVELVLSLGIIQSHSIFNLGLGMSEYA
jgi:hypothetical protein